MTVQKVQLLPSDLLLRICYSANLQTLVILRLVSKLFANSETLHERLFALEHPNLNLTLIRKTSWTELRIQRALAERNLLGAVFWKELIFTLPPGALHAKASVLQERPFITYWTIQTDPTNPSVFSLYDVQKKQLLSFPVPFHMPLMSRESYSSPTTELEEIEGGIYVSIEGCLGNQLCFFLLKASDRALTEIHRYFSNEPYFSSKWIFCKETNSFCLALTTENQLKILQSLPSSTACKTKSFSQPVKIAGHFFLDDHSLLMLYFFNSTSDLVGGKITVYDFNTLENCFDLELPFISDDNQVKVLLQDQKLLLFSDKFHKACVYEIPSFPQTAVTYKYSCEFDAGTYPLPIYFKGKMHYITDGGTSPDKRNCRTLGLATLNSFEKSELFVFPSFTRLTPYESQGLPAMLAFDFDGKRFYVLNFTSTTEKQ